MSDQRGNSRQPIGRRMLGFARQLMRTYLPSEEAPVQAAPPPPPIWKGGSEQPLNWSENASPTYSAPAAAPTPEPMGDYTPSDMPSFVPNRRPAAPPTSQPPIQRKESKDDARLLAILRGHQEIESERSRIREEKKRIYGGGDAPATGGADVQRSADPNATSTPPRRRGKLGVQYIETSTLVPPGEQVTPPSAAEPLLSTSSENDIQRDLAEDEALWSEDEDDEPSSDPIAGVESFSGSTPVQRQAVDTANFDSAPSVQNVSETTPSSDQGTIQRSPMLEDDSYTEYFPTETSSDFPSVSVPSVPSSNPTPLTSTGQTSSSQNTPIRRKSTKSTSSSSTPIQRSATPEDEEETFGDSAPIQRSVIPDADFDQPETFDAPSFVQNDAPSSTGDQGTSSTTIQRSPMDSFDSEPEFETFDSAPDFSTPLTSTPPAEKPIQRSTARYIAKKENSIQRKSDSDNTSPQASIQRQVETRTDASDSASFTGDTPIQRYSENTDSGWGSDSESASTESMIQRYPENTDSGWGSDSYGANFNAQNTDSGWTADSYGANTDSMIQRYPQDTDSAWTDDANYTDTDSGWTADSYGTSTDSTIRRSPASNSTPAQSSNPPRSRGSWVQRKSPEANTNTPSTSNTRYSPPAAENVSDFVQPSRDTFVQRDADPEAADTPDLFEALMAAGMLPSAPDTVASSRTPSIQTQRANADFGTSEQSDPSFPMIQRDAMPQDDSNGEISMDVYEALMSAGVLGSDASGSADSVVQRSPDYANDPTLLNLLDTPLPQGGKPAASVQRDTSGQVRRETSTDATPAGVPPSTTEPAKTGSEGGDAGEESTAEEIDIDKLAHDVYSRLRNRLRIENERRNRH